MAQTATATTTTFGAVPTHQKSLSASSNLSISASGTASIGSSAQSTLGRSTSGSNQDTIGRANQGTLGRQATLGRMGSSKRESPQEAVDRMLRDAGVPRPEDKSRCLRAGLAKGFYVTLNGEIGQLEQVVWQGKCLHCNAPGQQATLRALLDQPDDGLDFAQGAPGAVVVCSQCNEGFYISQLCTGRPERDTGKFHRHCPDCPGLGVCTQNAQALHCKKCNTHYDGGALGANPCPCAARQACCVLA